jgi:hypothetical protein
MVGTFGGALEARQIDASNGKLTADVTGEVETEDGVLVVRRIHVSMHLVASGKGSGRADASHLRHALPSIPDAVENDRTHFFFRLEDSRRNLISAVIPGSPRLG